MGGEEPNHTGLDRMGFERGWREAATGVTSMVTNWGSSLEVTSPAVGLAFTEENVFRDLNGNQAQDGGAPTGPFTVAAAYESGVGRVAVLADNAFQDHGFEGRENEPLARALLEWLTCERDACAQLTILSAVGGE